MLAKLNMIALSVFAFFVLTHWILTSLGNFRGVPFSISGGASRALDKVDFATWDGEIKRSYISQGYGATFFSGWTYPGGRHNGIDIVAKLGAPVLSATDGMVIALGDQDAYCYRRGYGKFVAIKNAEDQNVLLYAHLGKINVANADTVKRGERIGTIGASGYETGPHLHLSVFREDSFRTDPKRGCGPYPDGRDKNPMRYLENIGE